jgi:hypothetical protein
LPSTDAVQCEIFYLPDGWGQACRFVALREDENAGGRRTEQYQLFATAGYP